jgi:hypothetical protein
MDTNADQSEIVALLKEIRDSHRQALANQEQHIELVREQLQRSKASIEESISLQRIAIDKQKAVTRIALPGVILCIVLIVYLVIKYF